MRKRNIHTVYNKDKEVWQTKREGDSKPLSTSRIKEVAEEKSVREAKKAKVEHIIHNRDGRIGNSNSYGKDPNPPKDKKH